MGLTKGGLVKGLVGYLVVGGHEVTGASGVELAASVEDGDVFVSVVEEGYGVVSLAVFGEKSVLLLFSFFYFFLDSVSY